MNCENPGVKEILPSVYFGWISEYFIAPFAFPNNLIISRFFFPITVLHDFVLRVCLTCPTYSGSGWRSRYSDSLRAGRSGNRILVGANFSAPVQNGPAARPASYYNGYRIFPVGKAVGVWRWPRTPSSAEVKERVVLYLYYPCGPSWPVLGWPSPLPLPYIFCKIPFRVITKVVFVEKYTYVEFFIM